MFFLLRSACCIGLVVAALPTPGPDRGQPLSVEAARSIAQGAETLCRASPSRCRGLLAKAAQPAPAARFLALAGQARAHASTDTLTAADRKPAWTEPPDRSLD